MLRMNMRIRTAALLTILFWCATARGQDSKSVQGVNREVSPVDASVHPRLDDPMSEPAASETPASRPASSGHPTSPQKSAPHSQFWPTRVEDPDTRPGATGPKADERPGDDAPTSFRAESVPPASSGRPIRTVDNSSKSETAGKSRSTNGPLVEFGPSGQHDERPASQPSLQPYKLTPPAASTQPADGTFTNPFHKDQIGLSNSSAFPTPFPRTESLSKRGPEKGKQGKSHSGIALGKGRTLTGKTDSTTAIGQLKKPGQDGKQ